MGKFAENTAVTSDKTLSDIMAVLRRYKATGFGIVEDTGRIGVQFNMNSRRVRFTAPLPNRKDYERTPERRLPRSAAETEKAYAQATRQVWRALYLVIKAKLESVESGIETFEDAFMAQLVLPSGETVGAWLKPQIERVYATNEMPPLLPAGR